MFKQQNAEIQCHKKTPHLSMRGVTHGIVMCNFNQTALIDSFTASLIACVPPRAESGDI